MFPSISCVPGPCFLTVTVALLFDDSVNVMVDVFFTLICLLVLPAKQTLLFEGSPLLDAICSLLFHFDVAFRFWHVWIQQARIKPDLLSDALALALSILIQLPPAVILPCVNFCFTGLRRPVVFLHRKA